MRLRNVRVASLLAALCVVWLGAMPGHATTAPQQNLRDILVGAEDIVTGTVTKVTEGRTGNLPFVEVELNVVDTLKGGDEVALDENDQPVMTFRQFGTQTPAEAENGRIFLGLVAGMPRYSVGERVVLFLGAESPNGFRTTLGLDQGKFNLTAGNAVNGRQNVGLFQNLPPMPGQHTMSENSMLATAAGPISAPTFLGLVRRAVTEAWWLPRGGAKPRNTPVPHGDDWLQTPEASDGN